MSGATVVGRPPFFLAQIAPSSSRAPTTPKRSTASGGAGEIVDGRGKDDVYAGRGANNLIGYGGNTSMDRFSGGGGNDTVQSRDVPAGKAVVRCEVGTDTVYADKANVVSDDCERAKA